MNLRSLFLQHVAQTSEAPLAIEMVKARGSQMYNRQGKAYIDLIAGISVCNVGHCHPKVVKAIKKQAEKYLHLLVYGELVQSPQVLYAKKLIDHLPTELNSVYFTNSGAEAIEGAMKLAKRVTGKSRILCFKDSYHGSTQGALSLIGDEYWRNAYRPLLPDVHHLVYNDPRVLTEINEKTACIIMEPVQAEKGVISPDPTWIKAVAQKCKETGTLLIFDEIQAGFGRTGTLWAFQQHKIVPDVLVLGKALGGGMPLGAFVTNRNLMQYLSFNPVLGHITTFGGHPVSCAAGLAALEVLLENEVLKKLEAKVNLFHQLLQHEHIRCVRSCGMLMAIELESDQINQKVIRYCLENGVLTDWFLFAPHCLRIAPPLTISRKEIKKACGIILQALNSL